MLLEKDNVRLRSMEPYDVDSLYMYENDSSLWSVSDNVSPFSKEALRLFIQASLEEIPNDQLRLMIEYNGKTVGCIDLFEISRVNHHASVGILVYDNLSKQCGVASKALSLLEKFAYESLEMITLKAEVSTDNNIASQFFRKMGYTEIGIMKSWKRIKCTLFSDVYIFQHNIG